MEAPAPDLDDGSYESQQALDMYMLLNYGTPDEVMPGPWGARDGLDYPARLARLLLEASTQLGRPQGAVLELGCAVGRTAFELARGYETVVGIDRSQRFIEAALALQETGTLGYFCKEEGLLGRPLVARVDPAIPRERVKFLRGDAAGLGGLSEGFDAVLMGNLLCRLADPAACLAQFSTGILRPGGLLMLVSPYAWMARFTPVERWLGGVARDGRPVSSEDALHALLAPSFEAVAAREVPLVLRESARNFQYLVAQATLWRKRG